MLYSELKSATRRCIIYIYIYLHYYILPKTLYATMFKGEKKKFIFQLKYTCFRMKISRLDTRLGNTDELHYSTLKTHLLEKCGKTFKVFYNFFAINLFALYQLCWQFVVKNNFFTVYMSTITLTVI